MDTSRDICRRERRSRIAFRGLGTALALVCVGAPALAKAQAVVTAQTAIQGDARIQKTDDLDFGSIIPGAQGGTITVGVNSAVTTTGSVVSAGGAPHASSFQITRELFVDFPTYEGPEGTDTIELTNTSLPSETMTLRNFTTDFNRTGFFGLPAFFFQTEFDFRVGGTLEVDADQAAGTYVGEFTVTVNFN